MDEFGVKEIYHPTGGKWGSAYIDDQYIKLLQDIFSKEWMDEFKEKAANDYVKLIYNFMIAKESFYNDKSSDTHNVQLPFEFAAFIEGKLSEKYDHDNDDQHYNEDDDMVSLLKDVDNGEYIEHYVRNTKVYDMEDMIDCDGDYLIFKNEIWKKLFNFVVDPIMNHIEQLLRGPLTSKKFKYICLVGGLSCSKYFRSRIRDQFGLKSRHRLDVIVPFKPMLSVVQGAAFLGITPNFVRARRLQCSYGVIVSKPKRLAVRDEVDDDFIRKNEYYCPYTKKWKVAGCICIIASRNEEVALYGDEKKTKTFYRPHGSVKKVVYKVFRSKIEEPTTIDDGKVIATIDIGFEADLQSNEIVSEFVFSETMIEVYACTSTKRHQIMLNYDFEE